MPSLAKYFAFVGAALLALISLANFLLEPSTGATPVQTAAKPAPVVRHEPGASKIERWRNEQAALKAAEQTPTKAAEQTQTADNASLAAKSAPVALRSAVTEAAPTASAQPAVVQAQTPAPQLQTASAQPAEPDQAADAEAARLKAEKVEKAKAAKAAKKVRLARERARAEQAARAQFYSGAQQRTASNQQDAFYYGQRQPQQQQQQQQWQWGNAYAPRPNYGPFGWAGQGRL
jgi:hypothetical protein